MTSPSPSQPGPSCGSVFYGRGTTCSSLPTGTGDAAGTAGAGVARALPSLGSGARRLRLTGVAADSGALVQRPPVPDEARSALRRPRVCGNAPKVGQRQARALRRQDEGLDSREFLSGASLARLFRPSTSIDLSQLSHGSFKMHNSGMDTNSCGVVHGAA